MSILCGTDFSSSAREAADVAALLAKKRNQPLLLMHCAQDYVFVTDPPVALPGHQKLTEMLEEEAKRLRSAGANVVETFCEGDPAGEMVAAARKGEIELIVVGSAGKGMAGRWLLGSVTEDVAENSPVPTLVVREAGTLLSWLQNETSLGILLGVDLRGSSDAAITWTSQHASLGRVHIGAAYVHPGGNMTVMPDEHMARQRAVSERMQAGLGDQPFSVHVSAACEHPAAEFLILAKEQKAGLLVVGTHQHHGLTRLKSSSFSRRVLFRAETNVLCVPGHKAVSATTIPAFHRILVAVDLEEASIEVLRHAHSLLLGDGEIRLVHVCYEPSRGFELGIASEIYMDAGEAVAKEVEQAGEKIKALPCALTYLHGKRFSSEVLTNDDNASAICEAAERFGADVICMGTKRHSRLASALLGSTVQGVLSRSRRPVFIVPPPSA